MPLEQEPSEPVPESATQADEWDGPWGSISPVPHSVETLCIETESDGGEFCIYFYPYRTISKWNWKMAQPETLEIQVGGVQLTISGTGLRRLAGALKLGQLGLVRLNQSPDLVGETCILAILIDDKKS